MRFLIIGAGAIGGSAGAYLARGGHTVWFVDSDAEHVRAMQENGLSVEGREAFTVRAPAAVPGGVRDMLRDNTPELAILAVKAQHTRAALEATIDVLGPVTPILSVQNGLNPHEVAQIAGEGRTLAALANSMGADYLSPGRILFGGPGTIYLGYLDGRRSELLTTTAQALRSSFVPRTTETPNIWGYLWSKEAFGAMLFAGAVTDVSIADLLADSANFDLLTNIAREVVQVAEAEGVACEEFDGFAPNLFSPAYPLDADAIRMSLDALVAVYRGSMKPKSGIWRDLAFDAAALRWMRSLALWCTLGLSTASEHLSSHA